ncbi:hypothetical protein L6R52_21220 [Myxococcota bacterium]|nr:hypothetical protein [Myxococcota bacterium]
MTLGISALLLTTLIAQDRPPDPGAPEDRPMLLGQLLGAKSKAKVRVGLWFGNLSPGPMTASFDSAIATALGEAAPSSYIGRGSGVLRDLGVELTLGDYDLAVSFLSDDLFAPAEDRLGSGVGATVIKQLFGQLRSRAIRLFEGTETWVTIRTGSFDGPMDASRIGIFDGGVYFGGRDARWDTPYFSAELGSAGAGWLDSDLFFRFTTFSMPAALDISSEMSSAPLSIQTASVYGGGVGFALKGTTPLFSVIELDGAIAAIPFTGLAVIDYGQWGKIFGLLVEANARLAVAADLPIAGWLALRPYLGFEVSLVSPMTFSVDLDDLNAPTVVMPDFFIWGPQVGLEVRL